MARQFNIGRQNEVLTNEENYKIFKELQYLNNAPKSTVTGPTPIDNEEEAISNGALWIDKYSSASNTDLKYYQDGNWNVFFKDRFKITGHLLDAEEPTNPIDSQLWIDSDGVLRYYEKGQFKPIKATIADIGTINAQGFEDFIIVSSLDPAGNTVIDNFSQFLFLNTPITEFDPNKGYEFKEGCVHDLHIYICKKAYAADQHIDITNTQYWTKLEFLNQFVVPDAEVDKIFIDGHFIHQKVGLTIRDEHGNEIADPEETGYHVDSNVSVSFPIDMIEGKTPNAVHVNPKRLHNVTKRFIKIDKNSPIIEVPEENTEYYGIQGGIGRLLIKTNNEFTTDYFSTVSNNSNCIRLSDRIKNEFDFIYAITYSFSDSNIKQPGSVIRKKIKLKDENYVWIDKVDGDRICVFAQGFYYEEDEANYYYDADTGYLYLKEKLQDYQNFVKKFDFSVLYFPKIYRGKITNVEYDPNNYRQGKGYRIGLGCTPKSPNMLGFLRGVQLHCSGEEINYYQDDPTAIYIPCLTQELVNEHQEIYWCVAETDEYDSNNKLTNQLYRGRIKAIKRDPIGVIVPIYRDKKNPVDGALYLAENEYPILFVDGVLTFQKELTVGNDYITIYGLKEGQDVVMLGDTTSSIEEETSSDDELTLQYNSDRVLFEDVVSYATIPTETNDNVIVYLQNGILCDAGSVYTSIEPKDEGYHGEIRFIINYTTEKWVQYNGYTGRWEEISSTEMVDDPITGHQVPFIDVLDRNCRGYSATKKSISFLQNLENDYCTYVGYRYSDSIEKKLFTGYCYPNGRDGVNNPEPKAGEPTQFMTDFKHYYTPGRNELTVFLNGIRQSLSSPYDIDFNKSKNRECAITKNNEFVLAFDDGSERGEAIKATEGYYTYYLTKVNARAKTVLLDREMTDREKELYENEGYTVKLASKPNRNVIFYVIERCESGEERACERKVLTFKDALAHDGAFVNNCYTTGDFPLTRGNIRVFVNGLRQPYGSYQTLKSMEEGTRVMRQSFKILDARTIQFVDPLIGGFGGNYGTDNDPLFEIGDIKNPDGTKRKVFYDVIDEIIIETRRDFKLREITLPIKDNTGEFTIADGLPPDIFKTKDKIMIYINGLAYGREYSMENDTIKLLNQDVLDLLGHSKTDIITFEWR